MPNWCSNHMTIRGEPEEIAKFCAVLDRRNDDIGLFEAFVPYPAELDGICSWYEPDPENPDVRREVHGRLVDDLKVALGAEEQQALLDRHGALDGYHWCLKHWGCKWDVARNESAEERDARTVDLSFDTPWSPPIAWLEKVAEDHPELQFTMAYAEQGCGFAGEVVGEAGSVEESVDHNGSLWRDLTPAEEADGHELDYDIPEDIHPKIRSMFERHPQLHCGG